MKKRNKKYNAWSNAVKLARVGLKNLGVWRSVRDNEQYSAELVNYKTGKLIKVTQSMASIIINIRHRWTIHMLAIGFDGTRNYFKCEVAQPKHEMLQADLAEYLDVEHRRFVETEFNKSHLTNVAWLAIPNGVELENEEISAFLDRVEAW